MSTISSRERNLLIVTVLVLLYGMLGFALRKQLDELKIKRIAYANAKNQLAFERQMIDSRSLIQAQYDELKTLMPVFSMTKAVDTHWLGVMDSVAAQEKLGIARRQADKEHRVGDVYEFAIECREWNGRLDALMRFLYALESQGVMLDLRHLFIRPHPQNPGFLRGAFTLHCAYMRDPNAPEEVAKPVIPEGVDGAGQDGGSATNELANLSETNAPALAQPQTNAPAPFVGSKKMKATPITPRTPVGASVASNAVPGEAAASTTHVAVSPSPAPVVKPGATAQSATNSPPPVQGSKKLQARPLSTPVPKTPVPAESPKANQTSGS